MVPPSPCHPLPRPLSPGRPKGENERGKGGENAGTKGVDGGVKKVTGASWSEVRSEGEDNDTTRSPEDLMVATDLNERAFQIGFLGRVAVMRQMTFLGGPTATASIHVLT